MQTSQYTNIAFISYKREDEKWAKWLQKKLEYYKLPAEVLKQNPDLEFAKNPRHVFKDTTDLSGGVLAKAIKKGLDSSKFLIVICSSRAAKSEWVCKEVQDFIDSGREEYIIPFIIDGEPYAKNPENECFPEALKILAGERELLGININENGRESAAVKVIARMFDVRFDTLWDRFQREYSRRKNIRFIAILLFSIFISIIAFVFYEQNQELQKTAGRMEINQSRAVLEKAKQLIEEGDFTTALLICNEILPKNNDRKILPETESIMYEAYMQYEYEYEKQHKLVHIPVPSYHNNDEFDFGMVPGNTYVWTNSITGVMFFDVVSGGEIFSINCDFKNSGNFSNDGEFFICASIDQQYMELWNINEQKLQKRIKLKQATDGWIKFSRNNKQIYVPTESNSIDVYDASSLKYIETINQMSFTAEENMTGDFLFDWDSMGVKVYNRKTKSSYEIVNRYSCCRVGVSFFACYDDYYNKIDIYDLETGNLIGEKHINFEIQNFKIDEKNNSIIAKNEDALIILYFGVSNKKKTFVVKIPNEILNESYLQDIADGKIFLTDRPSENYYYDIASKSVLKQDIPAKDYFIERIGTEDFAQLYRYKKKKYQSFVKDHHSFLVDAWDERYFNINNDPEQENYIYHDAINSRESFLVNSDTVALIYDKISRKKYIINDKLRNGFPLKVPNSDRFLFFTKEELFIVNTKTWNIERCINITYFKEYGNIYISKNGKIVVREGPNLSEIYSSDNGKLLFTINNEYDIMGISPSGKYIITNSNNDHSMVLFSSSEGTQTCKIDNWQSSNVCFDNYETKIGVICHKVIDVYDINTNKIINEISGHIGEIESIALNSDGKYLLSCSNTYSDQSVRLWNVNTGKQIYKYNIPDIYSVQFCENDSMIRLVTDQTLFANYGVDTITIYKIPFYPFNKLCEQVRQLLHSRKLTKDEKQKYYLE